MAYRSRLIEFYETGHGDEFYQFLLQQQDKVLRRFRLDEASQEKLRQAGQTINAD